MKVIGIIAEYNPFHYGHLFHLEQSKRKIGADYSVAVMSGNFTQRGEPAMANKWTRAKMAVENGVDLVLELPVVYACNNAEYFAKGAVKILDGLGCITHLSFGSESGNIESLLRVSSELSNESDEFKRYLKSFLEHGNSFPKARQKALEKCIDIENLEIINKSNNILAIEYLKQLSILNSSIQPITIERKGAAYTDVNLGQEFSSAMSIRKALEHSLSLSLIKDQVPKKSYEILTQLNQGLEAKPDDFQQMIYYKLISSSAEELSQVFSITEGLENRLKSQIGTSETLQSLIENIKTKRYTMTRMQRILIHCLLHLTKADFLDIERTGQLYGRVLGFNQKGAELLKKIKKEELAKIPIVTNINKGQAKSDPIQKILRYDILASDLYYLATGQMAEYHSDYLKQPYYFWE